MKRCWRLLMLFFPCHQVIAASDIINVENQTQNKPSTLKDVFDLHHEQTYDTNLGILDNHLQQYTSSSKESYTDYLKTDNDKDLTEKTHFDGSEIFSSNISLSSSNQTRDERFSIFTVVRFYNGECGSGDFKGTCLTKKQCSAVGGSVVGSCARGFGSCCYKEISCGGSSSSNCTYLVSPNYPGTYNEARTCSMTITRTSDICQLRLDFVEFRNTQPDQFGICNEDQFTVPGERKFKYLCGNSPADWHFYLDVNGKPNPTEFNFLTSAASFDRKFKIKVSMIRCSQKVPCGCGQYYTGISGTYSSFNYGQTYLAGLDYGICFRKEKNYCTTTLTTLGYSFTSCPDLYRLPVGPTNGNSPFPALNVNNLYCQLNALTNPLFQSLNRVPSPISTVTNGPLVIWHMTLEDNVPNFLSNDNCPSCAGFFQMFTHNSC